MNRLKPSYAIWLIIGLGYLVFANSLGNQFFWDDFDNIVNNVYVHSLTNFDRYFSENLIAGANLSSNYWRPMMLLTWASEWAVWGNFPAGFRFVNISLHILTALLVFQLWRRLFDRIWLATIVAVIFVIHPLQTEAITYVSGLSDPLSGVFCLTGLLAFLRLIDGRGRFWVWQSVVLTAFAGSLMTRETMLITFPALTGLVYLTRRAKKINIRRDMTELLQLYWPIFLIGGIYFWLRATVLNFGGTFNLYSEATEFSSNYLYRIWTFFRVVTNYLELLIWPNNLHMERSVEIAKSVGSWDVLVGLAFLVVSLAGVIYYWQRQIAISFGIVWFWIWLFPTSNILVPINGLIYEHWLYLALVGFFTALVAIIWHYSYRSPGLVKAEMVVLICWLVFLGWTTMARNYEWRAPIPFYEQTLKYSPNSLRVLNNLAMAYADSGQLEAAIPIYLRASEQDRRNAVPIHNLGNVYRDLGQVATASAYYQKAIELQPGFLFSYSALIELLARQGDFAGARLVGERLLEKTNNRLEAYIVLAQLSYQQKDLESALDYLRSAQREYPQELMLQRGIFQLEQEQKAKNQPPNPNL